MKILTLKIGEKTYTTGRVTAFLSRKAMEISRETIELAKLGTAMKEQEGSTDLNAVSELMEKLSDLKSQKAWFISQVYGEKFTVEDLEQNLTDEEIDAEVMKITNAIFGVIEKNS